MDGNKNKVTVSIGQGHYNLIWNKMLFGCSFYKSCLNEAWKYKKPMNLESPSIEKTCKEMLYKKIWLTWNKIILKTKLFYSVDRLRGRWEVDTNLQPCINGRDSSGWLNITPKPEHKLYYDHAVTTWP